MSLSVAAALQLEVFSRTQFEVFAGTENLGRDIRWVHPVEIADIGKFLSGGELLLTAGLGIGRTPTAQRTYIQDVSAAGAAALIIELSGRAFTTMPKPLIEEAQRLGFPLIGLAGEVPFVEVSAQVHELIADARNADLEAFEAVNTDFMKILLASGSPVSITEALAHRVGCPVALESGDHELIAYAGGTAETDEVIRNWGLHARVAHRPSDEHRTHSFVSGGADQDLCTRRSIILRGEVGGWLHTFLGNAVLTTVQAYAIERGADSIAIAMIGDRERGVRAAQHQGSLINRLLRGDISGQQFVDRSLRIGRDLRGRPLAVVIVAKEPDSTGDDDSKLEKALKPLKTPSVVADIGDVVVGVVGLNPQMTIKGLVKRLEPFSMRCGVSRKVDTDHLPDAIRQARSAAAIAASRDQSSVLAFDSLGLRRLLFALAEGPELSNFVQDELGPILEHDAREANALMPTLRAIIETDGNKSRAAAALYVQRRTLYYRLERLNALLGRSIEDAEVRSGLVVAIQALDFLTANEALMATGRDLGSRR